MENQKWIDEVISCIYQYNVDAKIIDTDLVGEAVHVPDKNIVYHLLSIPFDGLQGISPMYFQEKSLKYTAQGIQLVHLWQDHWVTKQEIVRSRIAALSGSNTRLHARQTDVWRFAKNDMRSFFDANHLQGAVNARYHYGLYSDKQLVSMASFSSGRNITRNGVTVRSFELLRYANLLYHVVAGGLGKLIARFIKDVNPGDIMTYADLDWASGKGYQALDFKQIAIMPPQAFWIHPAEMIRYYPHRLPQRLVDEFQQQQTHKKIDAFLKDKGYIEIFNAGNLKYLLVQGRKYQRSDALVFSGERGIRTPGT